MAALVEKIEHEGVAVVPGVLEAGVIDRLITALDASATAVASTRRGTAYAMRNILDTVRQACGLPEVPTLRAIVEPVLGRGAFAVRGLLFDKVAEANWRVAWHQDRTIAVRRKSDAPGYGPWSVKAGVPHVQPPRSVLERMLTLRVHLDDCGESNGPLLVIPGSHRDGVLKADEIARWKKCGPTVTVPARAGDVVAMRPLLMHASGRAVAPSHRRVIHIEYAAGDLLEEAEWYERESQGR